jgi:sirohydrochlorin cobaltochelatase
VGKIKENLKDNNLHVFYSFLEVAEPSIFISINKAIMDGCKVIKIFPYFLAAGKHVKDDIPSEIKKFKKKYPEIEFILLPHIGECNGIENLILSNI